MITANARHISFKNYHFSKKYGATIRRVFWSCNLFYHSVVAALSFHKYTNYPSYSFSFFFLHNPFSPLLPVFSCTCSSYSSPLPPPAPPLLPPSSSSSSSSSSSFSSSDATTLRWFGPINKITLVSSVFEDLAPISQFNFFKSHLHLFLCCPLVLIPIWLRLVSLLTSFISYIQLRCPQRCILCAFIFSVYQLLQSLNIIYSPSFLFSCNDTCTIILQWPSHLFRV